MYHPARTRQRTACAGRRNRTSTSLLSVTPRSPYHTNGKERAGATAEFLYNKARDQRDILEPLRRDFCMPPTRLLLADVLNSLPPAWPDDPRPAIRAARRARPEKVVVLDDDPTGTQTVHGIPVLTEWSVDALRTELANDLPACFFLTNSRSLPLAEAQALNATIV